MKIIYLKSSLITQFKKNETNIVIEYRNNGNILFRQFYYFKLNF